VHAFSVSYRDSPDVFQNLACLVKATLSLP
jgi:hypothetical protein